MEKIKAIYGGKEIKFSRTHEALQAVANGEIKGVLIPSRQFKSWVWIHLPKQYHNSNEEVIRETANCYNNKIEVSLFDDDHVQVIHK